MMLFAKTVATLQSTSLFPAIVVFPAVANCAQTVDVPELWIVSEADLPLPLDSSQ